MCPKHGWSFDLYAGQADRGLYKLGIWEVQLRSLSDYRRKEAAEERQEDKV
jgi:nitrite reductase/ring-hydroxylating ferredoxin subunit